jgi:hypothetical protein
MQTFNSFLISDITYLSFSGGSAVFGFVPVHMQCRHHQSDMGGDNCSLRFLVGWFRTKLPVKFRHQTSYLSHVLSAVNMISQFDISFSNRKIQPNIHRAIQIFRTDFFKFADTRVSHINF